MTAAAFLAVMAAALLHAGWNAAMKVTGRSQEVMLILVLTMAGTGAVAALLRPLPPADAWRPLLVAGLLQGFYRFFLAWAYEHGDLSRVYPLARGAAPLLALAASLLLLPDQLAAAEIVGILVLGSGIAGMALGVVFSHEALRQIPLALASAALTAAYTVASGLGVRLAGGDAIAFVGWLMLIGGVVYLATMRVVRGRAAFRIRPRLVSFGVIGGLASIAAYALVVWAMTEAPVAVVAALRESSILFAMMIGAFVFRDPMGRGKWLSASLILLGMVVIRLGG